MTTAVKKHAKLYITFLRSCPILLYFFTFCQIFYLELQSASNKNFQPTPYILINYIIKRLLNPSNLQWQITHSVDKLASYFSDEVEDRLFFFIMSFASVIFVLVVCRFVIKCLPWYVKYLSCFTGGISSLLANNFGWNCFELVRGFFIPKEWHLSALLIKSAHEHHPLNKFRRI